MKQDNPDFVAGMFWTLGMASLPYVSSQMLDSRGGSDIALVLWALSSILWCVTYSQSEMIREKFISFTRSLDWDK